jgi:hypothetical protein
MVPPPGNGPDYYGSFTLQDLSRRDSDQQLAERSPGTKIILAGSGFGASETVSVYFGSFKSLPFRNQPRFYGCVAVQPNILAVCELPPGGP